MNCIKTKTIIKTEVVPGQLYQNLYVTDVKTYYAAAPDVDLAISGSGSLNCLESHHLRTLANDLLELASALDAMPQGVL